MPIGPNGEQLPYENAPAPDLAALLSQYGQMGEMPEEDEPAPQQQGDPAGLLREALAVIASYQEVEADDEDLLEAEEIRTRIQKLLAKQQKERDGLLQGKLTPAALR